MLCLQATGLQIFQICHCTELNKIVEATMPVNPYDDHKVSLRRPHRNSGLDIVRASYTRRKANVREALAVFLDSYFYFNVFLFKIARFSFKKKMVLRLIFIKLTFRWLQTSLSVFKNTKQLKFCLW